MRMREKWTAASCSMIEKNLKNSFAVDCFQRSHQGHLISFFFFFLFLPVLSATLAAGERQRVNTPNASPQTEERRVALTLNPQQLLNIHLLSTKWRRINYSDNDRWPVTGSWGMRPEGQRTRTSRAGTFGIKPSMYVWLLQAASSSSTLAYRCGSGGGLHVDDEVIQTGALCIPSTQSNGIHDSTE